MREWHFQFVLVRRGTVALCSHQVLLLQRINPFPCFGVELPGVQQVLNHSILCRHDMKLFDSSFRRVETFEEFFNAGIEVKRVSTFGLLGRYFDL